MVVSLCVIPLVVEQVITRPGPRLSNRSQAWCDGPGLIERAKPLAKGVLTEGMSGIGSLGRVSIFIRIGMRRFAR
jgi:hypothetical protein